MVASRAVISASRARMRSRRGVSVVVRRVRRFFRRRLPS